jgi:hypothetical protein
MAKKEISIDPDTFDAQVVIIKGLKVPTTKALSDVIAASEGAAASEAVQIWHQLADINAQLEDLFDYTVTALNNAKDAFVATDADSARQYSGN